MSTSCVLALLALFILAGLAALIAPAAAIFLPAILK